MLKLLSRQALKTLHNPFRGPLPNPLRGPLQTRYLHNVPAPPFSGPPSYTTIAQRFSALSSDPINFFRLKEAKEAMGRGQFVDIHDIGRVDPNDYEVLLTDINNDILHSEISKLVGIPYLRRRRKMRLIRRLEKSKGFCTARSST
jgi:hypothetical protein